MAAALRPGSGAITQFSRAVPYIRALASGAGWLRSGDVTDRGIQFR